MRETDTYGDYIIGICTHPWLRLTDGSQAVNLQRRFVGATLSHDGSHMLRHGETGQADLCGGLVIEWATGERATGYRIEIRLEVEVKTTKGVVSKVQKARRAAFQKRGGIYLVVRSIDDAVSQIVAEIIRVRALLGWGLPLR